MSHDERDLLKSNALLLAPEIEPDILVSKKITKIALPPNMIKVGPPHIPPRWGV